MRANDHETGVKTSYSRRAKWLHWLTVLGICITIPIGIAMDDAKGETQNLLYRLHWSFGLLVLFVVILRIANLLREGSPAPVPTLTPLQSKVSKIVHHALYALIFLVPLIGWAAKSAYGGGISFFGLFDMPAILAHNKPLGERLFSAHVALAFMMTGLIMMHVGAALFHYFVQKDGVLQRMLCNCTKK